MVVNQRQKSWLWIWGCKDKETYKGVNLIVEV